jgi:hypothetical protein
MYSYQEQILNTGSLVMGKEMLEAKGLQAYQKVVEHRISRLKLKI